MNIHDVTRLYQLAMQVSEAIEAADDPAITLIWYQVQASDRWVSTAGGCPFAELTMHEVLRAMRLKGLTSAQRIERIRTYGWIAGFLQQETKR